MPVFQIIGKETKENLKIFAEVFDFFLSLENDATGVDPDFLPFDTHVSSDMSASWKITGLGGGARGNVQFCTCCPLRSSRMHLPQECPCDRCVEFYSRRCYHHDFIDPATMDVYTDHKDELEADLEQDIDMATVHEHSTIAHSDPLVATEGCMNPHSIDFEPDEDDENEGADFDDLLSAELELRLLDASGDREEMRERLRERLEREKGLESIIDLINHSSKNLKGLVPTTKSIPCILHSEIRIAIKILTMIFSTGIDTPETKTAQVDFCDELAYIVNHQILGTSRNPSQWQVPVSDKAKKDQDDTGRIKIGDLRLQGPQVRKFMKNINLVILKCIPEDKQPLTLSAVGHYIAAEDILSRHHEYSDADIERFQTEADFFMREWVDLYALEGLSNYTHMFTSGPLMWFMKEYRNLHQLSQQVF